MAEMKTCLRILAVTAVACLAAAAQTPGASKDEGKTRGETAAAQAPVVFRGILIDAGCRDFSRYNLGLSPQALPAPAKEADAKAGAGVTASGITVDAHTMDAERADAMPHQVADLVSRQSDPTCAVKGSTRAYALLTPDGHVADLDEGGNTFADMAVKADSQGRAMLAGQGPGFKPMVAVTGHVQGSRIAASAVKITAQ
jgi:hypothetical protein